VSEVVYRLYNGNAIIACNIEIVVTTPVWSPRNSEDKRLKVLRAERDWTQANLADELGVSRQTINAIENGKFDPSVPLAFKVARLFE
jgi:putative transcriptional regulator